MDSNANTENTESEQSRTPENTLENDFLKRENALLRQQIEHEREQTDHWRKQATMLLTHQPEKQPDIKQDRKEDSPLWRKLFGRR